MTRLKNWLFAIAVLSLGLIAGNDAVAQAKQNFTLINSTGYTIDQLYIATPKADDWGNDVLGEGVLPNGARREIRFSPRSSACIWDMRIVFDDGEKVEWERFNLCEISSIRLRYNKSTGQTSAETN